MALFRWFLMLSLPFLPSACGDHGFNFSQYPGFSAWYAENPPVSALPIPAEAGWLERFKPRIFLPAGHEGPIDFYRDYIANGTLTDGDGK
ncbi:MAG: hypothetical protein ACR2QJ_17550, partial [Geminicoccaceae bacterium]